MIASQFVIFLIPKPQLVYVPSLRRNGELNQVELNFKPSLSVLYVIYQSCQLFVSAIVTSLLPASLLFIIIFLIFWKYGLKMARKCLWL